MCVELFNRKDLHYLKKKQQIADCFLGVQAIFPAQCGE